MDKKPTPYKGLLIHYVLRDGVRAGEVRAAIVTNTFGGDRVNGTVFVDELNDRDAERSFGSADYDGSDTPAKGTWHAIGPTDPPDPG